MQEFFSTTLVTKFIKYLLANTPIPQYSFISENQPMAEGCLYTYKNSVLYCTKSGRFTGLNGTLNRTDHLYAQESLRVNDPFNLHGAEGQDNQHMNDYSRFAPDADKLTDGWMSVVKPDPDNPGEYLPTHVQPLAVTDEVVNVKMYKPAEFKIVSTFLPGVYNPGITQQYTSNVSYYDTETHRWLGEYLRLLKNMYNLDLMSLYNCFNYTVVNNIVLDSNVTGNVLEIPNTKKKVILVPIKFNKTYTIALESTVPVQLCSVFYNDGLVMDTRGQRPLTATLKEVLINKNNTQFSIPFTYTSHNTYAELQKYERYLYLAIQVSQTNKSTIVVLEGDYSSSGVRSIADIKGLRRGEATVERLSSMMTSMPSLLSINDGKQHPFSNKLIEYLCGNTIDTREKIDENVETVINQLGNFVVDYKGQWSNELRYTLFDRYMTIENKDHINKKDILGYVDSDIENALRRGYMKK